MAYAMVRMCRRLVRYREYSHHFEPNRFVRVCSRGPNHTMVRFHPTAMSTVVTCIARLASTPAVSFAQNTDYSPTAWRTGQIDPELPFEIGPMNGR
jgi:hypothetical protein